MYGSKWELIMVSSPCSRDCYSYLSKWSSNDIRIGINYFYLTKLFLYVDSLDIVSIILSCVYSCFTLLSKKIIIVHLCIALIYLELNYNTELVCKHQKCQRNVNKLETIQRNVRKRIFFCVCDKTQRKD